MPAGHLFLISPAAPPEGGRLRILVQVLADPAPPAQRGILRLPLELRAGGRRTGFDAVGLPRPGLGPLLSAEIRVQAGEYGIALPQGRLLRRFRASPGLPLPLRLYCPHPGPRPSSQASLGWNSPEGAPLVCSTRLRVDACCTEKAGISPALLLFRPEGPALHLQIQGDRGVLVRRGEYFVAPPGSDVRIPGRQRLPARFRLFSFEPEMLERLDREAGIPPAAWALEARPRRLTPALAACLDRLDRALLGLARPWADHAVRISADAVLLTLLDGHPRSGRETAASPDPRLERAVRHLRAGFARPLTMREVARAAGASPSLLRALFRSRLGMSPLDYLQRLRVERAKSLLGDRGNSLEAVAAAVGYRDVRSFRRLFKAHATRAVRTFRPPVRAG